MYEARSLFFLFLFVRFCYSPLLFSVFTLDMINPMYPVKYFYVLELLLFVVSASSFI